ncbi:hypothetical protein HHI36_004662 [Cryptolaemus montrouzieri]|uniref:Uncharacterized protein n=1 Tax=Cryptolaemus montrouzieri TaxID=559131 RepID=A0ABD2NSA0_9CUCU
MSIGEKTSDPVESSLCPVVSDVHPIEIAKRKLFSEIICLEKESHPPGISVKQKTYSHSSEETSAGWKTARSKKSRNMRLGTGIVEAQNEEKSFIEMEKKAWIFIGRVKYHVT